jgi:pSer/pThr/pTyr-binding forkhead associated (FHA) protein
MAYLIFTTLKGRELARQTLYGPLVVGRSPECDVCVHDILLSRKHCQFEPEGAGWTLTDLASKNGTFLNNMEVGRHRLKDGETVNIGKTAVTFCAGKMERRRGGKAMDKPNKPRPRPADPWASLHDTMSGFDYVKALAEQKKQKVGGRRRMTDEMPVMVDVSKLPTPQPTPADPKSYKADDIYSLLTDLASSSWDSIYMNASRPAPTRVLPRPMVNGRHPRSRNAPPVDMSLQAPTQWQGLEGPVEEPAADAHLHEIAGLLTQMPPRPRKPAKRPHRWRRTLLGMARGFATVGQSVLVLGIVHLLGKM